MKSLTFFSEWLTEIGVDSKVEAKEEGKLTRSSWTVSTTPSSGAGTSIPIQTRCCRTSRVVSCGNWSDSWYCNDEYDAMYDAAARRGRSTRRVRDMIKEMQAMLYRDAPYLVTSYNTTGEAFRSDRVACLGRNQTRVACGPSSSASTTTSTCDPWPRPTIVVAQRVSPRRRQSSDEATRVPES